MQELNLRIVSTLLKIRFDGTLFGARKSNAEECSCLPHVIGEIYSWYEVVGFEIPLFKSDTSSTLSPPSNSRAS